MDKEWKISTVMFQIELIRLNEKGEVSEKAVVPDAPGKPAIGLVGAEISEDLKNLIFSRLKLQNNQ